MMPQQQEQPEQQQRWQQQHPPRIYEVTAGLPSKHTKEVYRRYFNRFLDHIQIHDLQVLLDFSPNVIRQMISDYILYLDQKRNVKRESIKVQLAAILRFFHNNNREGFRLTARDFQRDLPPDDSACSDDRPYTTEEIAQTLEACDPRTRVVILLLCSSGMRIGALYSLQICDLTPVNFQNTTVYRIQAYARTRDSYHTFCSPECYHYIKNVYLKERERSGEVLKEKSPLIREQFNADNPFTINSPRFISNRGIEYMIGRALRRAGVRKPGEVHLSHGYRKYFVSQCESSQMKSIHVSMLAGHDTGIKKHYYIPNESVVLEDFMTHAVDALTILPENRLRKQLAVNEEIHSRDYKYLRRQSELYDARAWEVLAENSTSLPKEAREELFRHVARLRNSGGPDNNDNDNS